MAISPTPAFITQVRYLATSIRLFGGALRSSPVIVTVGDDEPVDLEARHPWSASLGVEWRWVSRQRWERYGVFANTLERFHHVIGAPAALMLDADTLCAAPIDDALAHVGPHAAFSGVIAHASPFYEVVDGRTLWAPTFAAAGLAAPEMCCEHSGWQSMVFDEAGRYCPPYFNHGMMLISSDGVAALRGSLYADMVAARSVRASLYVVQLAISLSLVRSGIAWRELPLRFNYPNDPLFLPRAQAELDDLRIIHYLREEQYSRSRDFASIQEIGDLLDGQPLHAANERLWQVLRAVHEHVLESSH